MCVIYGEACFSLKKMFTNGLNVFATTMSLIWKDSPKRQEKHTDTTVKKILGTAVNKEAHAANLLGHERTHHYWFPWKQWFPLPTP